MLQPVAKAEAIDAAARVIGAEYTKAVLLTADMRGDAQALAFQNKMVADLRTDTGMLDKMIDVNVKAAFRLVHRVVPGMIERGGGFCLLVETHFCLGRGKFIFEHFDGISTV